MDRFRVDDTDKPTYLIVSARDSNVNVPLYDVASGRLITEMKPGKETRWRHFDADIWGDVIVTVGDDDNNVVNIYSASAQEFREQYFGQKEGGFHDVALVQSGSGAILAAGGQYHGGQVYLIDVTTCARAGKPIQVADASRAPNITEMRRDPANPSCFYAAYQDGQLIYVDVRTGKVAKRILGLGDGIDSLRVPSSTPGKGILSDRGGPVLVWDLGTGRVIHKIGAKGLSAAAMYGNNAVCFGEVNSKNAFYFYDLSGAGEQIPEADHDLRGRYANDVEMCANITIGISGGNLCSMNR